MITFVPLLAIITFHVTHYAGLLSVIQLITAKFLAQDHARLMHVPAEIPGGKFKAIPVKVYT